MNNKKSVVPFQFLAGGGEMGAFTRAKDWSKTQLGEFDSWPQSLRTTLSIILNSKFPMFLWWGDDLIQFYNDAYRPSFGNKGKHPNALGQKGAECWPEIWSIIKPLIDQVLAGGEATWNENQLIPIYRNGKLEDVYWTFSYSPVRDENDTIKGVLVVCNETTTQVDNLKKIGESESRFRNMVNDAPVSTGIFRGPDYIIELANADALNLWGKDKSVIGKKLIEAIPELKGQPFIDLLNEVYTTGKSYYGKENLAYLNVDGTLKPTYINFVYKALYNNAGVIDGILTMGYDVTEQVVARNKIKDTEERLRLAVDASLLGTYDSDLVTGETEYSKRFYELFGFDEIVSREQILTAIHPDDQEIRNGAFKSLLENEILNYEIRVIWKDGSIHWLNAKGKLFRDEKGNPARVLGTIEDVTNEKNAFNVIEEARQEARDAAERLSIATEGTRIATWDLDLQTDAFLHSPRLAIQFGHPESKILTHQQARSQVHPNDFHIVENAFEVALKTGAYNYEVRIVHPDKTISWTRTEGKVIFDDKRTPLRIIGTMRDVTDEISSEEKISMLASIVKSSNDAIISKTLDGIITSWNEGAQRVFGYMPEDIIGNHISILIPTDRLEEEPQIIARLKKGERVEHFETKRITKDKRLVDISLTISPLKDSHGNIIGASKIARDITEQKRIENKISESEERLKIVIDASELGTWELNVNTGEFIYSPRYAEILGYPGRTDISHAEFLKHIHPDDILHRNKAFDHAYKTGVMDHSIRTILNDGSVRWVDVKGKVFYDKENKPNRVVGTARDFTKEKIYQQRIEESEQRFRVVADTAPVLIWMASSEAQFYFFNIKWLSFTGRTLEQESGNGWREGIHPDDLQRCLDIYLQAFQKHEEFYIEFRLKRFDGEYRWISNNGTPRFTSDGTFEGYIGACMDIHDRIIFEEKLKESESRLRIAALSSELGTWYYNPHTNVLAWDNATREMYGVDTETPITVDLFWSKLHPDDREGALQKMLRALDPDIGDMYDAEYRLINLPGNKLKWIHAKGKAFFDESRQAYLFSGTVLDITEKRLVLEELQENERKFRLLADSMPQFIWTGDEVGNLNYFNQSVYNYSGLTPEQIGKEGWLQIVHPDEREENIRLWMEAVHTGQDFIFEHRFRKSDGQYRWQLSRAVSQRDAEGKVLMWVGTSTDIHDQKLMSDELEKRVALRTQELKKVNDELARSNTELASFSYVASHDLQEPLRKIQTFATRLLENEKDNLSDTGQDYFRRMQSASLRMQTLINDLLTYSRINTNEKQLQLVDLNTILNDVKNDLRETIEEKNAIIESDDLPKLRVIPFQFRQLLTNLIGNSLKFSKANIAPHIHIDATEILGKDINAFKAIDDAVYLKFTLSDNGIGFEQKYSDLIFQVFQRLHGRTEYSGTGIGLSICKKIIENHQGHIFAMSRPNEGATFTFYTRI